MRFILCKTADAAIVHVTGQQTMEPDKKRGKLSRKQCFPVNVSAQEIHYINTFIMLMC